MLRHSLLSTAAAAFATRTGLAARGGQWRGGGRAGAQLGGIVGLGQGFDQWQASLRELTADLHMTCRQVDFHMAHTRHRLQCLRDMLEA